MSWLIRVTVCLCCCLVTPVFAAGGRSEILVDIDVPADLPLVGQESAADLSADAVTEAPSAPLSGPRKKRKKSLGPWFRPYGYNASVGYRFSEGRSDLKQTSNSQRMVADAALYAYVLRPWLLRVSTGLSYSLTPDVGARALGGSLGLFFFSGSRFPLQIGYSRSNSRSATAVRDSDALRVNQRYAPRKKRVTVSVNYQKNQTTDHANAVAVSDASGLTYIQEFARDTLSLRAQSQRAQSVVSPARHELSLNVSHQRVPSKRLSLSEAMVLHKTRTDDGSNVKREYNNSSNWRIKGAQQSIPIRLRMADGWATEAPYRQSADISAGWSFRPHERVKVATAVQLGRVRTADESQRSRTENLTLGYSARALDLGAFKYAWGGVLGGSETLTLSERRAADGTLTTFESGTQRLTGGLDHALSGSLPHRISANFRQSIQWSSAEVGQASLSQSATTFWAQRSDLSTQSVGAALSDSRRLGASTSAQRASMQFSHDQRFEWGGWYARLSAQAGRSASEQKRSVSSSANLQLGGRFSSDFDVPGLRFASNLVMYMPLLGEQGLLQNSKVSLGNTLVYQVGLLTTRLELSLAKQGRGPLASSAAFSVTRQFYGRL